MSPAGRILLDTSVVIDHFRGDHNINMALETIDDLFVPSVVLGELYFGAFRSNQVEKHLRQITRFLHVDLHTFILARAVS